MNFKISKFLIFVIITSLLIGILPSAAEENSVEDAFGILNGIIEYECSKANADSVQALIDGHLTEKAGDSSEWYIIALCQHGQYDFSRYGAALNDHLVNNKVNSASSRLKMMLALTASGVESDYIEKTLDDSIGQQGIMSYIFGLHLLNNGILSEKHTKDSLIDDILSFRLSDGGFAVSGQYGDVDTTAMAVQALSPYYSDAEVKEAIDGAISFLSEKQKDDGGFASYGVNNPESVSQVIIALSMLGIDISTDERFIKNGNTVFDAISLFLLDDGSFSHVSGGKSNGNATVQVLCAMVSYLRMTEGKSAFYILDKQENAPDGITESSDAEASAESQISSLSEPEDTKIDCKAWVITALILLTAAACIILVVKKSNKRNIILVLVSALVVIVFIAASDFKSVDEYYKNDDASKENAIGTVTISIRCDTIAGKSDEAHIAKDGVILAPTEFEIAEGDTVYDILLEATAENKIHIETNGSPETVYVEGINNIYEFDFGDLSGWMYFVNGNEQNVGCGECELKPDDVIEWVYSCDMGGDLK